MFKMAINLNKKEKWGGGEEKKLESRDRQMFLDRWLSTYKPGYGTIPIKLFWDV